MIEKNNKIFDKEIIYLKDVVFLEEEQSRKIFDERDGLGYYEFIWEMLNIHKKRISHFAVDRNENLGDRIRINIISLEGSKLYGISNITFGCYYDLRSREIKLFEDEV